MTRRVVQIAVAGSHYTTTRMALCEDGTVWLLDYRKEGGGWHWLRMPPIPDDEPDTPPNEE